VRDRTFAALALRQQTKTEAQHYSARIGYRTTESKGFEMKKIELFIQGQPKDSLRGVLTWWHDSIYVSAENSNAREAMRKAI
jgi:hypothetical protein